MAKIDERAFHNTKLLLKIYNSAHCTALRYNISMELLCPLGHLVRRGHFLIP